MRKIEEQMIAAIKAKHTWAGSNTSVLIANGTDGQPAARVYLHGNHIATIKADSLSWTLAGWNTPTTRSRINALLSAFGENGARCYTKQGQAYFQPRTMTDRRPVHMPNSFSMADACKPVAVESTQWVQA